MPVDFKISADHGHSWLYATAENPVQPLEQRGDLFIFKLNHFAVDEFNKRPWRIKDEAKQILPNFYHVIDAFMITDDPMDYYAKLIVKVKPYTEDEKDIERLEYFINNL